MLSLDPSVGAFSTSMGRPFTPLRRESPPQAIITPRGQASSHQAQSSPSLGLWTNPNHRPPLSPRSPLVQRPTSPLQPSSTPPSVNKSLYDSNPRSPRVFSGTTSPLYSPHHQQQQSSTQHAFNAKNATTSAASFSSTQPLIHIYNNHQPILSNDVAGSNGGGNSRPSVRLPSSAFVSNVRQSSLTHHLSPMSRDISAPPATLLAGAVSPMRISHQLHTHQLTHAEMKSRHLAVNRVAFNQHRMRVKQELEDLDDSDAPILFIMVSKRIPLKSSLQQRKVRKDSAERSCSSSKKVRFSSKSCVSTFSIDSPPINAKPSPSTQIEMPVSPRTDDSNECRAAVTPPARPSSRQGTPVPHLQLSSAFTPALNATTPPPPRRELRQISTPTASIATPIAWTPPAEVSPPSDTVSSPQANDQSKLKKSKDASKKKTSKSRTTALSSSTSPGKTEKGEVSKSTRRRKTSRPSPSGEGFDEYGLDPSFKSSSKRRTIRSRCGSEYPNTSVDKKSTPTTTMTSTSLIPMFEKQQPLSETLTSNEPSQEQRILDQQ